ncbi:OLD family endonuclease [Paenibacillus polymyxa]|uniref:ATP-dependent nuclease n=1 Tax=Paenibacillus TaxID=44249 RepID=UPI000F900455|nr:MULTISPECIES: AAA family ATPase [Paenibacillus]MBP1312019.1 putative ATP-dependent endonuclease of OLD family [Paenibacillus sp. 1182]TKH35588.1 OLD family endonuclease [Paenibacillus polymyxa]
MSYIRIKSISVENYRSFGTRQTIHFPDQNHKKPVAIVGYNNSGKTNFLNAILYGIKEKNVNKDTFTINDFHNRDYNNRPFIETEIESSIEVKGDGNQAELKGFHSLRISVVDNEIEHAGVRSFRDKEQLTKNPDASGAAKYFRIFYVNFHDVKKELSTKKTTWGNLTSFLAKHIKKIVEADANMKGKRKTFEGEVKDSTDRVLADSKLHSFLEDIRSNYSTNLRDSNFFIGFELPDYEDIFLDMIFKIGLNGDTENLISIDHFGDGYISMFVMAIIQAIAESNKSDKCLFLFEEPESFLHENHQEYFYKTVLCNLAEKGHQVIYSTHSDKMIDAFDTRGLIRFEFDDEAHETILKYNKPDENISEADLEGFSLDQVADFNNYIKMIEPNLNKIVFSQKVVLVEGPNDLLTYKEIIKKKVYLLTKDSMYSETYLNFKNISIIPHHGKITARILVKLCKHLGVDFFCINDFDFKNNFISELLFDSLEDLKKSELYTKRILDLEEFNSKGKLLSDSTKRQMVTTNWGLIKEASLEKIHFNIPKLEAVIGYESNDKSSLGIWTKLQETSEFGEEIFPTSLKKFVGIETLEQACSKH